jgi:uncharacterized membrane protein (DUF485 family)
MHAGGRLADEHEPLRTLAAARWRIALTLTAVMIVVYFGFIALIAYDREFLSILIAPGLTVGIVLGALVIVVSWLLTFWYVRWANTHYDERLAEIGRAGGGSTAGGAR